MAYAKASLVQDIRHMLEDNPWETTSTTTATTSPVAVPDGTKWAVGDVGEWSFTGTVGGEQFLVKSISSNDLTVTRGYNGTTAEAHTSGDRVVKNPTYSHIQIVESIDRTIENLFPSAWKKVTTTLTPDPAEIWYDSELSGTNLTGMIDLIGGNQLYGGSNEYVGTYAMGNLPLHSLPMLFQRNLPTALTTSTVGVRFPSGLHSMTNDLNVFWRVKLTTTISGSDYSDLTEGLLTDIVANGAVARLLSGKDIGRTDEDTRLGEVKTGETINVASWFELKYREKLEDYRKELVAQSPRTPDQNYLPSWWR